MGYRTELDSALDKDILFIAMIMHKIDSRIMIAGGCLRDGVLGIPRKDIDVFIPYDAWDKVYTSLTRTGYSIGPASDEEYIDDSFSVYRTLIMGVNIDLVVCHEWSGRSMHDVLNSFDAGICQIGYRLRSGFATGSQFFKDYDNRTITRITPPHSRSVDHLNRLKDRFNRLGAGKSEASTTRVRALPDMAGYRHTCKLIKTEWRIVE